MLPPALASLGDWIEQLIAESTGKEGNGILPVVGEPLGAPDVYGDDRLFSCTRSATSRCPPQLEALEEHPIVRIRMRGRADLGAEMFRWELATAIVGYLLDINPFDQPDVEAAKVRAREALAGRSSRPDAGDARALLDGVAPPRYIAIQAFVAPTDENARAARSRPREAERHAPGRGHRRASAPGSCTRPGSTTRGARAPACSSR